MHVIVIDLLLVTVSLLL